MVMSFNLRPDEIANLSEIERSKKRDQNLKSGIGLAGGLGVASGTGISSKILPFLSEYIPVDLAIKGISKVSPKLGDVLKKGVSKGLDPKEGLNFVKEQFSKQNEKKQQPQQNRNIIEQYSPELHQFIKSEIGKGRHPLEAGARARIDKKHEGIIKKIEKDHKTDWSSILESVYGSEQQPQNQQ